MRLVCLVLLGTIPLACSRSGYRSPADRCSADTEGFLRVVEGAIHVCAKGQWRPLTNTDGPQLRRDASWPADAPLMSDVGPSHDAGTDVTSSCKPGSNGPGGTYVACGQAYDLIAAPAGCGPNPDAPACTGGQDVTALRWGRGQETQIRSVLDGPQNSVDLMAWADQLGPGSFPAVQYCMQLETGGYDDWYLPAIDELALMVRILAVPTDGAAGYWSSTERDGGEAWVIDSAGAIDGHNKGSPHLIRCMRRDGQALPPPSYTLPNPKEGYFVLSAGSFTGALGSHQAADARCLADLRANAWRGKVDAESRGLLDADHVRAFLCSHTTACKDPLPLVVYRFASSGDTSKGGASFRADTRMNGPGDGESWGNANYFGQDVSYWTHRGTLSGFSWGQSAPANCSALQGVGSGVIGHANATGPGRWAFLTVPCEESHRLICLVHPD